MRSDLKKALVSQDYAAIEAILANEPKLSHQDLIDHNVDHYLIASMFETKSPVIAGAVIKAHYVKDGCFIVDSINSACALLLAESKTRPDFFQHLYGARLWSLVNPEAPQACEKLSVREQDLMRADILLSALYGSLEALVPGFNKIVVDSFMQYQPTAPIPQGARQQGTFEITRKLVQSAGIPEEVVRSRNREVIDTQIALGTPDIHVLGMHRGSEQYDFEWLTRIVIQRAKGFQFKGNLGIKNGSADGVRRDLAIHVAKVFSPNQPGLLAQCVNAIVPGTMKGVDVSKATFTDVMGRLLDQVDSQAVSTMMLRGLTENPLIGAQDLGPLLETFNDFKYARDSGRFDLHDLLDHVPPSIQAQQFEADIGL